MDENYIFIRSVTDKHVIDKNNMYETDGYEYDEEYYYNTYLVPNVFKYIELCQNCDYVFNNEDIEKKIICIDLELYDPNTNKIIATTSINKLIKYIDEEDLEEEEDIFIEKVNKLGNMFKEYYEYDGYKIRQIISE